MNRKAELERIEELEGMISDLQKAQKLMFEVIELMEDVVEKDKSRGMFFEAYILDHIKIYTSEEHGFATADTNIEKWIKHLEIEKESLEE